MGPTIEIPDPADQSKTLTYRLRSLAIAPAAASALAADAEASEITRWANFCASCFSYKPNPPPSSYFERHYWNDPERDASLVKIVEFLLNPSGKSDNDDDDDDDDQHEEQWEIASSLRVFKRNISVGSGGTVTAGGIGEVCTSERHRRRSLSKMLLHDAIETMTRMGIHLSILHASPALQKVYERGGNYAVVKSRWSVVGILGHKLLEEVKGDQYRVRGASFPLDATRLATVHKAYSESRFTGCIIRSKEYWTGYISKELDNALLVLTNTAGKGCEGGTVIAWLSVRERGGLLYQLREFGVDTTKVGTGQALGLLLREAVGAERFDLHLPTAVLDEIITERGSNKGVVCSFVDWARGPTSEDDVGWMYRPIHGIDNAKEGGFNMVEMMEGGTERKEHLIWPTDSF